MNTLINATGYTMLRRAAMVIVGVTLTAWLVTPTGHAQPHAGFADESLAGAYALVGVGGANEAASVGVTRFDGAGSLSRTLVLNEAAPGGNGRVIVTIPATGHYTVNPDGTGTATASNKLPDGTTVEFTFDFVITHAERRGAARAPVGLALHMVQREPGIAAKLVTFDLTRLPD
jgi:hypothetical protein